MADQRDGGIVWTDWTWNPITGCSKVSQGCKNCYAERQFKRFSGDTGIYAGRQFTDVRCHEDRLDQPLRWMRPRKIFVNSMSDLFHEDVPDEFIDKVFAVMALARHHVFQLLTKRPERMREYLLAGFRSNRVVDQMLALKAECGVLPWSGWREQFAHVWLGVSVEDQATADERVPLLLRTPATIRFVSAEPLLGPVDFTPWLSMQLTGYPHQTKPQHFRSEILSLLDWIIVGGESGPKARPMDLDWVRSIRDQCRASSVPLLVKQLPGSKGKVIKDISLFPADIQIQEYPHAYS
ncbi:MAG TPA: phage Gp37/Gp68 family protein [Bacteroidota bacterium]|nr:phage Gp37/Gp68 family protein [Bacteroidota bacterium]